jgi:RimJ/RimL family protein N-acetyltransferase
LFDVLWVHHDEGPVYGALEAFASERIWGKPKEFGIGRAMAVSDEGKIIAVVLYTNYDPDCGTIEISAASDNPLWLSKRVLREMFEFPFNGLKCQAVIMRGDIGNSNLSRIAPAYGFKRYEIPRLRGRDKIEAVYVLSDDDWNANKFNKVKANEQTQTQ